MTLPQTPIIPNLLDYLRMALKIFAMSVREMR